MALLTISDIEEHFIHRIDEGLSVDKLLQEFANMIEVHFTKLPNHSILEEDSLFYGILVGPHTWVNLYYDDEYENFGFQMFDKKDGKIQGLITFKHVCDMIDLFMRLAINMGKYAN